MSIPIIIKPNTPPPIAKIKVIEFDEVCVGPGVGAGVGPGGDIHLPNVEDPFLVSHCAGGTHLG
jgi:hypothetical protein